MLESALRSRSVPVHLKHGGFLVPGSRWIPIALLALGVGGAEVGAGAVGATGARDTMRPRALFPILQRGRWGFIDSTGRVAVPPRFESTVAVEVERRAGADQPRGSRPGPADMFMARRVGPESTSAIGVLERGRWGLVDPRGAMIGRLRFDEMGPMRDGLAPVRLGERWGFVDGAGRLAIPTLFDEAGSFSGGLCVVTVLGKRGVIDDHGRFVLAPRFELIMADDSVFHDNRAVVMMDGKMGYTNRAGIVAVPPLYDHAYRFSEGLAAVVKDGGTGYVDTTGRLVIAPRFESGAPFERGLACVMVGELYGFIDRSGTFVAKPQYTEASSFAGNDRAVVRRGQESGTLDRSGRWRRSDFDEVLPIDDSLVVGKVGGRTGLVRRSSGTLIEPYLWDEIGTFSEGLASVRNPRTRFGFIDVAGRVVIPPRFDDVDRFRHGLCKVAAGDTLGYVGRTGAWVWFRRFDGFSR